MERKMRRFKQLLDTAEVRQILHRGTNGILSLVDTDGSPYGVPLSYVYDGDSSIFFHCARSGRKNDCIAGGARCSFCVVDADGVRPEEFTTYFRSVICSGTIAPVTDPDDMLAALRLLCDKYSPGIDTAAEIDKFFKAVMVLRLDISSMTGKQAIELFRRR